MGINTLFTAVSGMQANQNYLSTVANNLSNVNTVGFKESRTLFADTLSDTLLQSGPTVSQIGSGVATSSSSVQFTQGSLNNTGVPTDMAIQGNGFFVVSDPVSAVKYFTRAGATVPDSNGFLTTPTGQRLMGVGPAGNVGDPLIDLQIPTNVGGVAVTGFTIDQAGTINASLADGTSSVLGKVAMDNFSNPDGLAKVGDNLYSNTSSAGELYPTYQTPGSSGLGSIQSGFLELSNVDLSQEFANMILAQRGLEANSKVVSTEDEILQAVVGMIH